MTEKDIQKSILNFLKGRFPEAIVWKLHENQFFGVAGVPDIFFAYQGIVIFFEVKTINGHASPLQDMVILNLKKNKINAHIVRDLASVKKIIKEIKWP